MLRSRNFLDVRLSASGIKKPILESRAGLLRKRLVQLGVTMAAVVPTVARTVGTPGAKAIASITNATAEIVTVIFVNMMTPRSANTRELIYFVKL